ncbi:hypothetical protein [Rhizobium leguminosarum]|uniref:hypothetical protein n=1 Tax=Rhizobium leguminosarum TaxID=384 RepID=UPI002FF21CBE
MSGFRLGERGLEGEHGSDIRRGGEIGRDFIVAEQAGEEGVVEGRCGHERLGLWWRPPHPAAATSPLGERVG